MGCKPGQTQIPLRNLPGQPREQVKMVWGYKKHSSIITLFRTRLFCKAMGSLRSNAVPSTTTNVNHRAQTSWGEEYRIFGGSNMLFFPPFSQKYSVMGIKARNISQPLGRQPRGMLARRGLYFKASRMPEDGFKSYIFAKSSAQTPGHTVSRHVLVQGHRSAGWEQGLQKHCRLTSRALTLQMRHAES